MRAPARFHQSCRWLSCRLAARGARAGTLIDHNFGRVMNANIAEYHVPVHADVHDIKVIFVEEPGSEVNPMGIKGVGEIGIVGVAAAVANAIYHATGKRVRDLPITLNKIIG